MMEYVWLGIILVTLAISTVVAIRDLRSEDATYSRFFSTVAIGGVVVGIASVGLAVTMFMD